MEELRKFLNIYIVAAMLVSKSPVKQPEKNWPVRCISPHQSVSLKISILFQKLSEWIRIKYHEIW